MSWTDAEMIDMDNYRFNQVKTAYETHDCPRIQPWDHCETCETYFVEIEYREGSEASV